MKNDIRGANRNSFYKGKSEDAVKARLGPKLPSKKKPIECIVYDTIFDFKSIDSALAGYIAEQIGSKVVSSIPVPGSSLLGGAAGKALSSLTKSPASPGIRFILIVCADKKRYVGAFNLPKAKMEGRLKNTIHFWDSTSWVWSNPSGKYKKGSPPLLFQNYWEASD